MKKLILSLMVLLSFIPANAAQTAKAAQGEYEREIGAIVRNKYFYKTGRIELGLTGGIMPYDSLVEHYIFGGRASWHLHDHFGWEIIDAQIAIPKTTSFATGLVSARGLSNLQTSRLKQSYTTNILLSPFYGKIRFFGSQVLYFDIYFVLGGGLANTETMKYSTTATDGAVTESQIRSGMEMALDWGGGFKIFMNDYLGILIDIRDYMVNTEVYGKKAFKSNFSVFGGICLNMPGFP